MDVKNHNDIANRLLELIEKKEFFSYRIITKPIAKISFKECLVWTISLVENRLSNLAKDTLSKRTVNELKKIKSDFHPNKAVIFDELSFKNWQIRDLDQKPFSIHLALARICWACLGAICQENNLEYKSIYRNGNSIPKPKKGFINLENTIAGECASTIEIVYQDDYEYGREIANSYSQLMKRLEK